MAVFSNNHAPKETPGNSGARGCYAPDELQQMHGIVIRMETRLQPFDMASRFDLDLGIFNNQHKRSNQQQKTRSKLSP